MMDTQADSIKQKGYLLLLPLPVRFALIKQYAFLCQTDDKVLLFLMHEYEQAVHVIAAVKHIS